jgi:hypothetical protein
MSHGDFETKFNGFSVLLSKYELSMYDHNLKDLFDLSHIAFALVPIRNTVCEYLVDDIADGQVNQ